MAHHQRQAQDKRLRELGLYEAFKLTDETHRRAVALLTSYGNVLSKPHSDALFHLVGNFAMLALGKAEGRYAFDLGTGCGKTTCIVAFISALHSLGRYESVGVASEKFEGLCQVYRDLIAAGVPRDLIGLKHSYQHDPDQARRFLAGEPLREGYASEASLPASADMRVYPYVLYTHSRAYWSNSSADALDRLSTYLSPLGPRQRSLILWDEALLSSQHVSVHWPAFEAQLGGLLRLSDFPDGNYEELRPILAYFEQCSRILKTEWQRQKNEQTSTPGAVSATPEVFKLPVLPRTLTEPSPDGAPHQAWKKLLSLGDTTTDQLLSVLEQSNRPARLVTAASGVISFDVAVPDALHNIAILDASTPIRKLMDADSSIQRWRGFNGNSEAFDGRVVDYSNVTIRWAKAGAGRSTVENDSRQALVRDVVRVIQSIPRDEAVLVFTFKPRTFKRDTLNRLQRKLEEAGVSLDETIEFRGQQRPRIVFLTWGQETSLSHFQYCRNVITCGVLERSDWDIAGAIAGQRRDLRTDISYDTLRDIKLSEAAHILYQAFSRGSARVIVNGKASPMNVWLCHREADELQETLSTGPSAVMPGAVWVPWETEYLPQWSKISAAVAALREALPGASASDTADASKLLVRDWRARAGIDRTMERDLFRQARDLALEGTDWQVTGQHIEKGVVSDEQKQASP